MKYNPAEAAVVWHFKNDYNVKDANGKQIYTIKLSEREADAEMEALKATGFFQQCGTYKICVNTQQAARVYFNDGLRLEGNARQVFGTFSISQEQAEKTLEAMADASPIWIKVPGVLSCLNANALGSVRLKGDVIEFIGRDGNVSETSGPVGADNANPVIARAKAAIDACKSIKAVAPSTLAEAPPSAKPTKEERKKLKELFNTLKGTVFGQDDPLEALADAVIHARAGLQKPNKPVGSFLFLGPTGVGKTEAARQLAQALGYDFKKFDMSEYVAKIDASRLTGGSPNYVGYEEGGQLTNFVREHKKCVLLFDEIEKAHPDVANVLLQVLDDAKLTDGKGKTVLFNETVIIFTSNLGTSFGPKRQPIGFGNGSAKEETTDDPRTSEEVKGFFLAEFMNRLTDVIRFKPLTPAVMLQMVDKFVSDLTERVKAQDAELTVTPAARKLLAEEGFSAEFGARPLERVIQKASKPLAEELLFGKLEEGGVAIVDAEKDQKTGKMTLTYRFNEAVSNDNTAPAKVMLPAKITPQAAAAPA